MKTYMEEKLRRDDVLEFIYKEENILTCTPLWDKTCNDYIIRLLGEIAKRVAKIEE